MMRSDLYLKSTLGVIAPPATPASGGGPWRQKVLLTTKPGPAASAGKADDFFEALMARGEGDYDFELVCRRRTRLH